MSGTVDLDEIEQILLQRVTPDNVTSLLLLDIARSLRALTGRGETVSVTASPEMASEETRAAAREYMRQMKGNRNPGQAERPGAAAVPPAPPSTQVG